jgi:hypothetical protein
MQIHDVSSVLFATFKGIKILEWTLLFNFKHFFLLIKCAPLIFKFEEHIHVDD